MKLCGIVSYKLEDPLDTFAECKGCYIMPSKPCKFGAVIFLWSLCYSDTVFIRT